MMDQYACGMTSAPGDGYGTSGFVHVVPSQCIAPVVPARETLARAMNESMRLVDAITRLESVLNGAKPTTNCGMPPTSEQIGIMSQAELLRENITNQTDRLVKLIDQLG